MEIKERNLEDELREKGLTEQQVIDIMLWTETLPISILSLDNVHAEINWGRVMITPNVLDHRIW